MKNASLAALCLLLVTVTMTNCQQQSVEKQPAVADATSKETPLQRGEYLSNILGCDDCHTPKNMTPQGPVPDMARRFMGHPAEEPFEAGDVKKAIGERFVAVFSPGMTAAAGPWGISYAANLTPDDTGIGNWTEEQFIKAIREGKSKGMEGTRPILPPMPWPGYAKMTDDDLKAMFAYLKTVKPIQNVVPNPKSL
ncbi:MAG: diheme cytochrome c-553 [Saprospiraceae bacterium]|nr:diheme cytochrome c-553 [Saprospiraceae bacterium]